MASGATARLSDMGRAVLITGGGKGLGRFIAKRFAANGDDVAILGRDKTALLETRQEIVSAETRGKCLLCEADLMHETETKAAVESVLRELGRIDIAILNAGAYLEKPITETSTEEWERIIATNLTGNFFITRAIVPAMIKAKGGRFIAISSVGGHIGLAGKAAYCASKFGVAGFFKALAKELKPHKISVSIVYPYFIDSHLSLDWEKHDGEILNACHPDEAAKIIMTLSDLPLRAVVEDVFLDVYSRK